MVKTVLVTGGCGFLGSHIVELLCCLRKGLVFSLVKATTAYDSEDIAVNEEQYSKLEETFRGVNVRAFDMRDSVQHSDEFTAELWQEVEWIKGNLLDMESVRKAVQGCDAVIHTASLVDFGNTSKKLIMQVNVKGTKNIIAACKEFNVTSLIYTSSLEVLITTDGVEGLHEENAPIVMDTDLPYQKQPYLISKTKAEKLVRSAQGTQTDSGDMINVGIIRCVGMYGERDPYHIASVLTTARELGSNNIARLGDGSGVFQHAYAGNVAHMHICVLNKLLQNDGEVSGEVFMGIDNTKVVNFFDFFDPYLVALQYKVPTVYLPTSLLLFLASISELGKKILDIVSPDPKRRLLFTKQAVYGVTVPQWFDTDKAYRLTGYNPIVSPMRARELSIQHFLRRSEFPKGSFKYKPGAYNYYDDGKNFRPDHKLRKTRREAMRKNMEIAAVVGISSIIILSSLLLLLFIKR